MKMEKENSRRCNPILTSEIGYLMNSVPANFDKGNWRHWLAFGFGSGFAPKAPGTFGTVAALLIYIPLSGLPPLIYGAVVVAAFLLGIWICETTSHELGVHDHGGIVWDEFVGMWLALFLVPPQWLWVLVGFLLFRALDILKPWPIKWADTKVEGGLGIMLDDVLAGIMAALCIHTAILLLG